MRERLSSFSGFRVFGVFRGFLLIRLILANRFRILGFGPLSAFGFRISDFISTRFATGATRATRLFSSLCLLLSPRLWHKTTMSRQTGAGFDQKE